MFWFIFVVVYFLISFLITLGVAKFIHFGMNDKD